MLGPFNRRFTTRRIALSIAPLPIGNFNAATRRVHPTFAAVPFEVFALPFQRLAGAATTHGIDRRLHLLDPSFEQAAPLAANPRLTLDAVQRPCKAAILPRCSTA